MLLTLRLDTLWNDVDFFVICESRKTISGKDKDLNFNPNKYTKYLSKIRYLVVEQYPFETSDPWRNERYQRDYLGNALYDAEPNDLIMISDVDEIPMPRVWLGYESAKYKRADCNQLMFAYFLNNRWDSNGQPVVWVGTKMTLFRHFVSYFGSSMELLRNYKATGILRGLKRAWFKNFLVQNLTTAGWHFTWMTGVEAIIKKLESFAHQEFNKPENKDPGHIRGVIESGRDILFPGRTYVIQEIDQQFPKPLILDKDRYSAYLLNKLG